MTTSLPPSSASLLLFLALCCFSPATPARAQNIVVMVNGDPITDFDIDQRSKLD